MHLKQVPILRSAPYLALSILLFACYSVQAQKPYMVGGHLHYGFIASHTSKLGYIVKGHVPAMEFEYLRPTDGSKIWQRVYNQPVPGISFFHAYLANPKQLGNAEALYAHLNFPLRPEKKFNLNFRVGTGLVYINRIFDRINNHKNNAIGAHLNGFVNLRFNSHFHVNNALRIETGLGLTHFSNGAFKIPNLGLNIPTFSIGFNYLIGKMPPINRDTVPKAVKKWYMSVIINGALNEIEPPGGSKFTAAVLSWNMNRTMSHKTRIGTGLDLLYNTANIEKMKRDSIFLENNIENIQIGTKITYEFTISKLSFPVEMGAYVYTKFKGNGYLYHRIGLRYEVTPRFIATLMLKTHFANADFFEWGVGYKFN